MNMKKIITVSIVFFIFFAFISPLTALGDDFSSNLLVESPAQVKAGETFKISLIWKNWQEIKNGTLPAVWFKSSDTSIKLPDPYTFIPESNGTHNFDFEVEKAGEVSISAFDLRNPLAVVTRKIDVIPSDAKFVSISPKQLKIELGETFNFEVFVQDEFYNDIVDYKPNFSVINETGNGEINESGLFVAKSKGKCVVKAEVNGIEDIAEVVIEDSVIKDVKIEPKTMVINSMPDYTISFTADKNGVKKDSSIFVFFPEEFLFPCSCHKVIQPDEVSVNGVSLEKAISLHFFPHAIEILSPVDIAPFSSVVMKINKSIEIKTPITKGKYSVGVGLTIDGIPVYSPKVEAVFDGISNLKVNLSNSYTGALSHYQISFTLGNDALIKPGDFVILQFPDKFQLPRDAKLSEAKINGKILENKDQVMIYGSLHLIKLTFSDAFSAGSNIEIEFGNDFGIRNPVEAGNYIIKVSASFDVSPVNSLPFEVSFKPLLECFPVVQGELAKDRLFKTYVRLSFSAYSNIPYDKTQVFYAISSGEAKLYDGKAIEFRDGSYKVTFFATDMYGFKSLENVFEFSVDTTPPTIKIFNVHTGDTVYSNLLLINGTVSEKVESFLMNNEPVELDKDLHFSVTVLLKPGSNISSFFAKDFAGNSTRLDLIVQYVEKNHFLTVSVAPDSLFVIQNTIDLTIQTKVGSIVTLATKDSVGVYKLKDAETFHIRLPVKYGSNKINVYSTDIDGETLSKEISVFRAKELLEIPFGGKYVIFNERKIDLVYPLIISNGHSFMSLSDIKAIFGERIRIIDDKDVSFSMSFDDVLFSFTLNGQLKVKGEKVLLQKDFLPFRKGDMWFLPLRVMFERAGYNVIWNEEEKGIIICK